MSTAADETRADFGDPSFDPTDAQLELLAKEAFAGVAERHRAALARLRDDVAVLRARVLAQLDEQARRTESER
ncbi:MAG: hypothetical protein DYH12_22705 [Sorangiineae bacterium PRO1]|nr:hypothetical protein [Sorangiineae bacterium PRO1]